MTTQIEPGIVEVTVVARDSTPAMRVITHLANTYVLASGLGCGLYSPGCVYRRLRVNTTAPYGVSALLEDGEPYAAELAQGEEPFVADEQARVRVAGTTDHDVEKVRQGLLDAFEEVNSAVKVSDYVVPEPRDVSVDLVLETLPKS